MDLDASDFLALVPDASLVEFLHEQGDLQTAWRHCERADWLLALGAAAGIPRPVLVSLACDLIEDVARAGRHSLSEGPAAEAWQLAKLWSRGVATSRECWAAGFRARQAAETTLDRACAEVALACDGDAAVGYYAERCHVGRAAACAAEDFATPAQLAMRVRARLRVTDVGAGLMRRALRAIPPAEIDPGLPSHDSDPPPRVSTTALRDAQSVR